jgi:glyoxylase-like metal-dependent hydrolase (beta-lactamase superfamily II)
MRVHHLNCVSSCPLGGRLMDGVSARSLRGTLVCHCLLVESERELVLVDTGYGLKDVENPRSRLSPFFLFLLRPELNEELTAFRQIQRLGFEPRDVRHVVLTHLDFDHAGGLDDFPWARVHLLADEVTAATNRFTPLDQMRYRPQQWSTQQNWTAYTPRRGERWFGFESVRDLAGISAELLLVPLIGHTLGHAGVAVRTASGWLLLAGDAYFYHREMDPEPYCTPGLRAYQRMMDKDRSARLQNQARLRRLRREHGTEVEVLCAHDLLEFERIAGRPHDVPAAGRRLPPEAPLGAAPSPG